MKTRTCFITVKPVHILCLLAVVGIGVFILAVLGRLLNAPGSLPVYVNTPVNIAQYLQSI